METQNCRLRTFPRRRPENVTTCIMAKHPNENNRPQPPHPDKTAESPAAAGADAAAMAAAGAPQTQAVAPPVESTGPTPREQLRQDRAKITRSLKRRILLITVLMNLSCLIMIGCIYFLTQTNDAGLLTLIWLILIIDVVFLTALGVMIFRHYRQGKQAMKKQQKRQEAMRAKRLLRSYAKKLSKETQAQLMSQGGAASGLGMYLKLKKGELSNTIQFLCMTGRKGELALQFPNGKRAALYLDNKTVVHAQFGNHTGLDALAHMLQQGDADATFYEGKDMPEKTIDMPVSQLLLEASVRSDEMAAG